MPLCFRQGKRGLAGLTRAEQDHPPRQETGRAIRRVDSGSDEDSSVKLYIMMVNLHGY
jgi:hypothetical protein